MTDVRRLTWEDLGFSQDAATGQWTESAIRASAALTWEDVGFVLDRSGRWVESAVRAGHHFDPSQLRDPGGEGGGQWVRAIFRETVHAAAGDVSASADRTGTLLRFGNSASGRLDDHAIDELADLLGEVGHDDHGKYPRVNSVHTYAGEDVTGFAELRRPDPHTAELQLLSSDDRLPLSADEAQRFGTALLRARSAQRIDADSGTVDAWVADHDDSVLRVAAADGDPVEVHLTRGEVQALTDAVERAASGRTGTVQTTAGPVKVRRVSAAGAENTVVQMGPADGSWFVIWQSDDALSALESMHEGLDRFEEWRGLL